MLSQATKAAQVLVFMTETKGVLGRGPSLLSGPGQGHPLRPGLRPDPETRKPEPSLRSGDKHGIYQNTPWLTNTLGSWTEPGWQCLYKAGLAINCEVIVSGPAPASPHWHGNTLQTETQVTVPTQIIRLSVTEDALNLDVAEDSLIV